MNDFVSDNILRKVRQKVQENQGMPNLRQLAIALALNAKKVAEAGNHFFLIRLLLSVNLRRLIPSTKIIKNKQDSARQKWV